MHRLSRLVLAAALGVSALTVAATAHASAATTTCSDMAASSASPSKNGGHDSMDMGHDDMYMGNKKSGSKNAKEHNCPTVAGAREITVTGDAYTFTPSAITVAASEDVTIALSADDIAHDLYVKGVGHIVHAKAGKTAMGGLRIKKAGTYTFWCTVPGHKKSGMTGTITVT